MNLLGKLFGKRKSPNLGMPDEAFILDKIHESYTSCKVVIFKSIKERLEHEVGGERASAISGYASNIATGEPHSDDLLAKMSAADKALAVSAAEEATNDPSLIAKIGDGAWWRAQGELMAAWRGGQGIISDELFEFTLVLLRNAIAVAGDQPKYLTTVAWAYLTCMRIPEAYDAAGVATARDGTNPEAWRIRGNAALMLGRAGEAESFFGRALDLAPGNPVLQESLRLARAQDR